ncbi:MAG: TonB-dependent receptor [Crocinitomicaceae bacterium]|nr:TonB-dependent receptor [Crocinitomicaceae bacterium]
MKNLLLLFIITITYSAFGQHSLEGVVMNDDSPVPYAKVKIKALNAFAITADDGSFKLTNLTEGEFEIEVFSHGFELSLSQITIPSESINIELISDGQDMEEVVVSGTLKEVTKKESTVNVEVFSPSFFKKNPSASVYDALQNVNGVRPQLNCNICSTGDIHINGLEGPYTMVLIDGMPIVSSLSTVYGLSGIPNSIVERIEIVKGPASTLYGSEAIGGIINIITKRPQNAPIVAADVHTTSWLETSADVAVKFNLGKKVSVLTGINYFNYDWKQDNNNDGFTDVTLQDRVSVFQKWNIQRKDYRLFSIAARYLYEDRWGGEMNWNNNFRGGDSIYGESIYTTRWELLGSYQLPMKEKIFLSASLNNHDQNSYYGTVPFMAQQFIGFGQLHWDKKIGRHDLIVGAAVRYTQYDDSTPATQSSDSISPVNKPSKSWIPGAFIQDEIRLGDNHKLLLGLRYDHNSLHGSIFTPRIGYKWTIKKTNIIRLNAGTGYRIVNIFTEDHAALTGSRTVIIEDDIAPEQSYNANLNFNKTIITKKNKYIGIDFTAFYTYFTNRIIADYEQNPNEIYYANLSSHAISQGLSIKFDLNIIRNLKIQFGGTYMDIASYEGGKKNYQILTEKFSGTWSASYTFPKIKLVIDYTGNIYSPMRLPLLNDLDPRAQYSPWWSIQNIQFTYKGFKSWEIYTGVKNFLNWTPNKGTPFIIARSNDPFDKNVSFDSDGNALPTANNPYGLTFDPSYVYAPNQGIRAFLGVRYTLK